MLKRTLWWVMTRTCNLACPYCYQGEHVKVPDALTAYMPDHVLERARVWAREWCGLGLGVNIYGGEPLLAFDTIAKHVPLWRKHFGAAGKPITFGVTTNGTQLHRQEVRKFLDDQHVGILLSLDGPKRLHEQTRKHFDGRGSWDEIDPQSILRWRPNIEIAWQLDPSLDFEPSDIDHMVRMGFRLLNFNVNWLVEWDADAQMRLMRFFKHAGRLINAGKMRSYWSAKLDKALRVDKKMVQPCGTGLGMLAVTPEGYLYPSQEMAFTVFEPGKAPGTAEHYRVGNVMKEPVIDEVALARVSSIQTADMRPPAPFDCEDCVAKSASIGGCHCRYVGQDGYSAENRFEVAPGYCQSMRAAMTGLIQAACIDRAIPGWKRGD